MSNAWKKDENQSKERMKNKVNNKRIIEFIEVMKKQRNKEMEE